MSWHEVHIEAGRARELTGRLLALRPNAACDPANVPPGTLCYEYPRGREHEFNRVADALGITYEWGIISQKVVASALIGTLLYVLATPTNTLTIVNVADPSNLLNVTGYDLFSVFAVDQAGPTAIAVNGASNLLYVQNAEDAGVPVEVSYFAIYDVTSSVAVLQKGTINLGVPTAQRAYDGNSLVARGSTVWSLLGGDGSANAGKLRKIDASNVNAPVVSVGPVSVGTFADQPRRLALSEDGTTLYVLSGGQPGTNQKVFVYDAATLVLSATLPINDPLATVGLANFFVRDGKLNMMAGDGVASATNLLIYSTSGERLSSINITTGPSGRAIAGKAA